MQNVIKITLNSVYTRVKTQNHMFIGGRLNDQTISSHNFGDMCDAMVCVMQYE